MPQLSLLGARIVLEPNTEERIRLLPQDPRAEVLFPGAKTHRLRIQFDGQMASVLANVELDGGGEPESRLLELVETQAPTRVWTVAFKQQAGRVWAMSRPAIVLHQSRSSAALSLSRVPAALDDLRRRVQLIPVAFYGGPTGLRWAPKPVRSPFVLSPQVGSTDATPDSVAARPHIFFVQQPASGSPDLGLPEEIPGGDPGSPPLIVWRSAPVHCVWAPTDRLERDILTKED